MRRPGSALLLASALAALLPARPGAAEPWVPPGKRLEFAVLRDGTEIGRRVLTFAREDGRLVVDTRIEIAVRMLFVVVHRFERRARSVWRDGLVERYEAETDENGEKSRIRVTAREHGLAIDVNGSSRIVPRALKTREFWNIDILSEKAAIDTATGTVERIVVSGPEQTSIQLGNRTIPARHYRLTGKTPRELWYGQEGGLLQISRQARDGSTILTRRRF